MRGGQPERAEAGLSHQINGLADEVQLVLTEEQSPLADELGRIVADSADSPAELRAATLAGWLKAALAVEAAEEKRPEPASVPEAIRRKLTIGFKARPPARGEASSSQQGSTRSE